LSLLFKNKPKSNCWRVGSMPPDQNDDAQTEAEILREVAAEVAAMEKLELRGPASFLAGRLAARGVDVSVRKLRSGEYRPLLERVWRRRPRSVRKFGPTDGNELRPKEELIDHVIDLKCRIGRVRSDIDGKIYDRSGDVERDARSLARCAVHSAQVIEMAKLIEELIPEMAAKGIMPTYRTVSDALKGKGHLLDKRSIRRQEAYWRPIRNFRDDAPTSKVFDPERERLSRLVKEELGAMIVTLKADLRVLNAQFEASLID
jgi:hypothetical protein